MSKVIKYILLIAIVVALIPVSVANAATYVTRTAANARSCPEVSCSVVKRLAANTSIEVSEIVEGDRYNGITQWLKTTVNGRTAYVHASLARLSSGAAPVAGNSSVTGSNTNSSQGVPTQVPATPEPQAPAPALSCGNCSSMSSCSQAYACLAAGHGDLDRDKDGIPCESIC